jgi:hypothetical protein
MDSESMQSFVADAGIILPQGRLFLLTLHAEGNHHTGMKFSEKYELLETLTTGTVETFVANDRIRGERVLVHIVECAPQKPDQTTAEWVLESFRKLAPEAPGLVLETGKYNGPKYAYVVVKPADDAKLKAWVRHYELQADETKETKAHALRTEISSPAAGSPVSSQGATKQPAPASGSMTQLFRDYDSLAKSRTPELAATAELPSAKPDPSTNLPGDSGLHVAPRWDQAIAKPGTANKQPPFTAPVASAPVRFDSPAPSGRDSAKPGEFTSFFQGPFRGDTPSDVAAFSSQPIEPPKKTVGEFTALFGQATPSSAAKPTSANSSEPSFTSIFKDMGRPSTFNPPAPVEGPVIPAPVQPLPSAPPMSMGTLPDPVFVAPTPVAPTPAGAVFPPPPSVPVGKPAPPRPASLAGDGATGAFLHPAAETMPVPIEAPSGPSPYTQIISRPKAAEADDAEAEQAPAAAAGAGKFAVPSMPAPSMPKLPPPPRVAPPPVSKMKAPPAPKVPKTDAPRTPPVSMWPLILTLTVLFFLAVILVLFFVFRH